MLENFPLDQTRPYPGRLALVLIAALVSRWQKLDLEKDILIASVRAFVQLIAIGYALTLIFSHRQPAGHPRPAGRDDYHRRLYSRQARRGRAQFRPRSPAVDRLRRGR